MANASISGLASGLDTATIVNQLMQLEAISQNRLKSRVGSEERAVTSLTTLNARVAGLTTTATSLARPDSWGKLSATSTDAKVAVSAQPGSPPTAFSVTVDQTARSHQLTFADATALDADVLGGGTLVRLHRPDGPAVDIETGDGTLAGLAAAINGADAGLRATTVRVADGQYRLMVESTSTGAASEFSLTQVDDSPLLGGSTVRTGQDAVITVGGGITVTSSTNTFAEVVPGLSLTVAPDATGTTTQIAVAADRSAASTEVKKFVDSLNSVLTEIDSLAAYNDVTKARGVLTADPTARGLRDALVNSIFPADGSSLAEIGIQIDRLGKVVFDAAAFATAYEADPAAVAARFTSTANGMADRVATVASRASDPIDGTLTSMIKGRQDGITRLNASIDAWDTRLELRRTNLTRQFAALETALGQMNSQSNWLGAQLATLTRSSTGS